MKEQQLRAKLAVETHSVDIMNSEIVKSRFLSKPQDLGVVAVGFSKGQVCKCVYLCDTDQTSYFSPSNISPPSLFP